MGVMKGSEMPQAVLDLIRARGVHLPEDAVVVSVSMGFGPNMAIEVEYFLERDVRTLHTFDLDGDRAPRRAAVFGGSRMLEPEPGASLPEPDPSHFWTSAADEGRV